MMQGPAWPAVGIRQEHLRARYGGGQGGGHPRRAGAGYDHVGFKKMALRVRHADFLPSIKGLRLP